MIVSHGMAFSLFRAVGDVLQLACPKELKHNHPWAARAQEEGNKQEQGPKGFWVKDSCLCDNNSF